MSSADPHQPAGPQAPDAPVTSGAAPQVDNARRRFVGKGLAVPAVLTVASSPVMAQQVCFTPSASTSLHPSGLARHTATSRIPCGGLAPKAWVEMATMSGSLSGRSSNAAALSAIGWPAAYPPDKKFSEVFKPRPRGIKRDATLADVLAMNNQPAAQAVIATLLNVTSGKVDPRVLSGRTPQDIWRLMNSTAGFVPFAGAKPWSATKVTAWLATTWGGSLPADFANWA